MKVKSTIAMMMLAASALAGNPSTPAISGDYLEVRSCDIYTGPCFANSEMGLTGKEGILVWAIREGSWNGTSLKGLSVVAVVCVDGTLGDQRYQPRSGKAVIVVDANADAAQREALQDFARTMAGSLIKEVAAVKTANMDVTLKPACGAGGCASVKAGNLVQITSRCMGDKDHFCGNEEVYYPPLTTVTKAMPAFTELASYQGNSLNLTWESRGQRSTFVGSFTR